MQDTSMKDRSRIFARPLVGSAFLSFSTSEGSSKERRLGYSINQQQHLPRVKSIASSSVVLLLLPATSSRSWRCCTYGRPSCCVRTAALPTLSMALRILGAPSSILTRASRKKRTIIHYSKLTVTESPIKCECNASLV